jgi:hypothetical protein
LIKGHCVRAFLTQFGTTAKQLSARLLGISLASLARLFHLAAIRPDKSRGPANRRGRP